MTDASCFAIFFNVLIDKSDVEFSDLIKKTTTRNPFQMQPI